MKSGYKQQITTSGGLWFVKKQRKEGKLVATACQFLLSFIEADFATIKMHFFVVDMLVFNLFFRYVIEEDVMITFHKVDYEMKVNHR